MKSTISRDQFKRLCANLAKNAPALLKPRQTDKRMNKESVLLKEMYARLLSKLGIKGKSVTRTGGFDTFAFAYEAAVCEASRALKSGASLVVLELWF